MAKWLDEQALNETLGKNEDKIYMVQFCTEWCKNCKKVSPLLKDFEEEYSADDLRVLLINVDEEIDCAEKHNISSVPTTCIYKGSNLLERIVGAHDREIYQRAINRHIDTKPEDIAKKDELTLESDVKIQYDETTAEPLNN